MLRVAVGAGFVIHYFLLLPVYRWFAVGPVADAQFYRMALLGDVGLPIAAIVFAWFWQRKISLRSRLPHRMNTKVLTAGASILAALWVIDVASRTVPYAAYLLGSLSRLLLVTPVLKVVALGFVLYGLTALFLAARPYAGTEPSPRVLARPDQQP